MYLNGETEFAIPKDRCDGENQILNPDLVKRTNLGNYE